MIKKIKLPVSIPIYAGTDKVGLGRRKALYDEAKRRGISISKLVWELIEKSADGIFADELRYWS